MRLWMREEEDVVGGEDEDDVEDGFGEDWGAWVDEGVGVAY